MYSAFTLGVALWLAYGWVALRAWPIVVANAITLCPGGSHPRHEATPPEGGTERCHAGVFQG